MQHQEGALAGSRGVKLFYQRWLPEQAPAGEAHDAGALYWRMIFSEHRRPLFRIMLKFPAA